MYSLYSFLYFSILQSLRLHEYIACLNSIPEEIKSRLKSRNAYYHSVQNLFSSSLLSKNIKIKTHRTTNSPVVLYECETWLLTLREERKPRVFEKWLLMRIFGPNRDEVRGEWRKLHNKDFSDLCSSHNTVRVIKPRRLRRVGYVARTGKRRGVYSVLVGKPEGKRLLGRHRRRRKYDIKMALQEVG